MIRTIQKHTLFLVAIVTLGISIFALNTSFPKPEGTTVLAENTKKNEKTFTSEELKKYDGTDPTLPIYLALDGNVYDVTSGKEYYKLGGPYHSLAGKDSSTELHMAGGSIIQEKYKIVGKLVK